MRMFKQERSSAAAASDKTSVRIKSRSTSVKWEKAELLSGKMHPALPERLRQGAVTAYPTRRRNSPPGPYSPTPSTAPPGDKDTAAACDPLSHWWNAKRRSDPAERLAPPKPPRLSRHRTCSVQDRRCS